MRVGGERGGTRMGVHHEEVDGVGTYVEHTESHNSPRYAIRAARRSVVTVFALVSVVPVRSRPFRVRSAAVAR
ncbi:hypothetical protein GCM10010502_44020 [Kitasatospora aureofaciens]|uniref:Uncharacterized protein n=1 Tax=Kitasatospora aureofaciens TaxID=1894 RepID=A0A8H9HSD1_KITAU|nr:hypothetical protein GCM10010502_44020 [Kitasatospora aureofaciens]